MFNSENHQFQRFHNKIWLSSPTMHGEELQYITEAYRTNWMSTVGANINEIEKKICAQVGVQICGSTFSWNSSTPYGSQVQQIYLKMIKFFAQM